MEELVNSIVNFEWDFAPVWAWAMSTLDYWVNRAGLWAYLGLAIVIIILGLSNDLTHQLTSLVVAGVIKGIFYFALTIAIGALTVIGRAIGNQWVARSRDGLRFFRGAVSMWFLKDKEKEGGV